MIASGMLGSVLAWVGGKAGGAGALVAPLALAGGLAYVGWTVWDGRDAARRGGIAECRQATQQVTIEQLQHETFRRERAEQQANAAREEHRLLAERFEARTAELTRVLDARPDRVICYPRAVARQLNGEK
jgi:hypothetical protein